MSNRAQGLRIGVALGSGGARGWAHIGVLRALTRAGIAPDIAAGTSIGAIVGGAYAAGRLAELETFARGLDRSGIWRLVDFNRSVGGGLVTGERVARLLDEIIGAQTIETLPKKFAAVATELATGNEVWIQEGSLVEAMRASYALPGILLPPVLDGRHLVDGGLNNPVPVSACRAMGAHVVIAVALPSGPLAAGRRAARTPASEATAWQRLMAAFQEPERLFARQIFGDRPGALTSASVSLAALNIVLNRVQRIRLATDQPDVIVAPDVSHVAMLEFDRAADAIDSGEAAVESVLPEIEAVLAERKGVAAPPVN
jgi:NTE family protein